MTYAIIEDTSASKRRYFIVKNPIKTKNGYLTEEIIWASDKTESLGKGIEFIGRWKVKEISEIEAFLEIL
jgi:hypothetical protein